MTEIGIARTAIFDSTRNSNEASAMSSLSTKEMAHMGFVNEYASAEDIQKHGLEKMRRRYRPFDKRPLEEMTFSWTVDRESEIFLRRVAQGYEETSNRTTWVLDIRCRRFEIMVDRISDENRGSLGARPFRVIWALVQFLPLFEGNYDRDAVLRVFKDALTVYGFWGVEHPQIPETIVSFQF